jgi:hypothetical protein
MCCSVVLARPHTGRMHQIRVHLQHLGQLSLYSVILLLSFPSPFLSSCPPALCPTSLPTLLLYPLSPQGADPLPPLPLSALKAGRNYLNK